MVRRVNAALLYLRRFINYFRTSPPYVSGDSIADLCGTVLFPHKLWNIKNKFRKGKNPGLVFCSSSNYLMQVGQIAKKVYVQNLDHAIDNFEVLPIGIENLRLGQNGRLALVRKRVSWKDKKNRVLIGPFSNTHPERLELLKLSELTGLWDIHSGYISPRKYAKISGEFKFVACPRGNGLDTHRFWETLYRGSIPIVKDSTWARLIARLGIPLLMVPEWTPDELSKVISSATFEDYDPKDIAALWTSYWDVLFTSHLGEINS